MESQQIPAEVAQDAEVKPSPPKTSGLWALCSFTLALLIALMAAAYYFWPQLEARILTQLSSENQALSRQLDSLQNQQGQSVQRLGEINQVVAQQRILIAAQANALEEAQRTVQHANQQAQQAIAMAEAINGQDSQHWQLAEADFLLRMAGRKLYMDADISTALSLLADADQVLAELNDASLFSVRQAIALDSQQLRPLVAQQTNKHAITLASLATLAPALPIATVELPAPTSVTSTPLGEDASAWENFKHSWRSFVADFITVRPRVDAVKPLMSEQQAWLLRQQLKLQLLQAQLAAQRYDLPLYQQSLASAKQLLVQEFDVAATEVQSTLETLEELLQQPLTLALPQTLHSREALKRHLTRGQNAGLAKVGL